MNQIHLYFSKVVTKTCVQDMQRTMYKAMKQAKEAEYDRADCCAEETCGCGVCEYADFDSCPWEDRAACPHVQSALEAAHLSIRPKPDDVFHKCVVALTDKYFLG